MAKNTPKTAADTTPAKPGLDDLPESPRRALVRVFEQVALAVGEDKAKRVLVENYGTEDPGTLKSSQLMDAIDELYEAV